MFLRNREGNEYVRELGGADLPEPVNFMPDEDKRIIPEAVVFCGKTYRRVGEAFISGDRTAIMIKWVWEDSDKEPFIAATYNINLDSSTLILCSLKMVIPSKTPAWSKRKG